MCPRSGKTHKLGEPGFSWPAAAFALSLPDAEKQKVRAGENEGVAKVRDQRFVRGVLYIPVHEWDASFGIGLWITRSLKR